MALRHLFCGSLLVLSSATGQLRAEDAKPASVPLTGTFYLHEPVALAGTSPAVLRTAKVGDRMLIQVLYAPEGSVVAKKVAARAENGSLIVVDVIPMERRLAAPKASETAAGRDENCFAVLLRAAAPGACGVVLVCEMSDGTEKKVPFQFKIE